MNEQELMEQNAGVELIAQVAPQTLAEFQEAAFNKPISRLARRSQAAGTTDTVLHIGTQLHTEDILGRPLHICRVGYASVPVTDEKNNPVWEVNESGEVVTDVDGNPVQKRSVFPVCHFVEAPGYWYNGGTMLDKNIREWIDELGDDPSNYNLPLVNQELAQYPIPAFFSIVDKTHTGGRKYVKITFA